MLRRSIKEGVRLFPAQPGHCCSSQLHTTLPVKKHCRNGGSHSEGELVAVCRRCLGGDAELARGHHLLASCCHSRVRQNGAGAAPQAGLEETDHCGAQYTSITPQTRSPAVPHGNSPAHQRCEEAQQGGVSVSWEPRPQRRFPHLVGTAPGLEFDSVALGVILLSWGLPCSTLQRAREKWGRAEGTPQALLLPPATPS